MLLRFLSQNVFQTNGCLYLFFVLYIIQDGRFSTPGIPEDYVYEELLTRTSWCNADYASRQVDRVYTDHHSYLVLDYQKEIFSMRDLQICLISKPLCHHIALVPSLKKRRDANCFLELEYIIDVDEDL